MPSPANRGADEPATPSQRRRRGPAWSAADYSSIIPLFGTLDVSNLVTSLGRGGTATFRIPPPGSSANLELAVSTAAGPSSTSSSPLPQAVETSLAPPDDDDGDVDGDDNEGEEEDAGDVGIEAIAEERRVEDSLALSPSSAIDATPTSTSALRRSSRSVARRSAHLDAFAEAAPSSPPSTAAQASRQTSAGKQGATSPTKRGKTTSSTGKRGARKTTSSPGKRGAKKTTSSSSRKRSASKKSRGNQVSAKVALGYYNRHVKDRHPVDGDGHCGFASLAKALGLAINGYEMRLLLMRFLDKYWRELKKAFAGWTEDDLQALRNRLLPNGRLPKDDDEYADFAKKAPREYYMTDDTVQLVAEMENRPIVSISRTGGKPRSQTYVPTMTKESDLASLRSAVGIVFNGKNHYDWVTLKDEEPLPPVCTRVWLKAGTYNRKPFRSEIHLLLHEKFTFEARTPGMEGRGANNACSCERAPPS